MENIERSMEYRSPVVYEEGRTADNYSYEVILSPLHGDSYYNVNQSALALVEDERFSIEGDHVLAQFGSDFLAHWEFQISGSLHPDFDQQLVSGLTMVTSIPFSIRNTLISSINGLVRARPSTSTRVSIGVHALINLYLDGVDEDEEEEEEQEYTEFLHEMEMARASSRGFVVLELETVKIEGEMKEDRCAVCLEEFITDSKAVKLHCSHIFHDDCVRPWLENRGTCPMCRSELSVSTS